MSFAKGLLIGYAFLVLTAVGVCAIDQAVYMHSKYLRATLLLTHYEARVKALEIREELHARNVAELNQRYSEFQEWRVSITLASRIGWPAARRYLDRHPLEDIYVVEAAGLYQ